MCRKIVRMLEMGWFHLTKEEALPILSILGTFAVIMIFGYILNNATNPAKYDEACIFYEFH